MTRNQSLFFRFLLFLAGVGIIILAFFLTNVNRQLDRMDAFVWTSIIMMYLVFFVPFFFSVIRIANFSEKIPHLSIVWLGIFLYLTASVLLIFLLRIHTVTLNTAIIIQAVLLFFFLVDIYFAYFASSHVRSVAVEEDALRQYISEIKSKSQVLSLSVNRLPPEYEKVQKILKQTLEDIRFISPVKEAGDLEMKILRSLDFFCELCGGISSGVHPASLEVEASNLQMLVNERKLLRN